MDDGVARDLLRQVYQPENSFLDEHGRHAHHIPSTLSATDRQALAARALAPNTWRRFTHADAVRRIRAVASTVDERVAADAFVASLATDALAWRGVLPAWALGMAMPAHRFPTDKQMCDVCFVQRTVTLDATQWWWHRSMHGSPLAGDVCGYLLLLEWAAGEAWPIPGPREVSTLHAFLDAIRELPPATTAAQAAQQLHRARLLPTRSKYAYSSLLEDLAFLGVLQTPDHPGMLTEFTTARKRDERPHIRVEVSAPLSFWKAAHGITDSLVQRLFGHLRRPAPGEELPPPSPPAPKRPSAAGQIHRTPAHIRGEPLAGDVYAIRCREDAWVLAFCHEVEERGGRQYSRIEYLDGLDVAPPAPDTIGVRGFRGRAAGRWQQWTSRLDGTTGVRRIARGAAAPPERRPAPDRVPLGNADDLKHLSGWCFPELRR